MAKPARKPRRSPNVGTRPAVTTRRLQSKQTSSVRVHSLDALRGLAILLMIIDHVSGILFSVNIEYTSIRFWTRLSMPLFAVLMGYFFHSDRPTNYRRVGQIAFACVLVNILYVLHYGELEILASLLCAYLLFVAMRSYFAFAFLLIFLAPWDISARLFDYPLAIVIPCTALGTLQRKSGWRWAATNSLLALPVILWMPDHTQYVLYFVPPAVLLIAGAVHFRNLRLAPLEFLGRYPLTVYVVQYLLIFAIAAAMR
jgi:surface polysaccharide O-acyltransferase-like enzyme